MQKPASVIFVLFLFLISACDLSEKTKVSIRGNNWFINDKIINEGTPSEGLLMNVRMVNSVFEDRGDKMPHEFVDFDPDKNTDEFISRIPEYVNAGANAFTISLQGGSPGYEGAVNSAFEADGSLREDYLERVKRVIKIADKNSAVIILSCLYQRQNSHLSALNLKDDIRNAIVNTVKWIKDNDFKNIVLEISNEYRHGGYRNWKEGKWLISTKGQTDLINLAKKTYPDLLVGTSGMGSGTMNDSIAEAVDYITIHFNTTALSDYPAKIMALKKYGKPLICNEDDKIGNDGAEALRLSVNNGCAWGYMNVVQNQTIPFRFEGIEDDTAVYNEMKRVTRIIGRQMYSHENYFPEPDSNGGWRTQSDPKKIKRLAGIDKQKLDEAFEFVRTTTRNGGLLVVRNGWLVYENYFGKGQREAAPNLASCGKSFTSISVGILMSEHPELFPDGLDQKIFTPVYLPDMAFPLSDPKMAEIKLGQLLSFSAGIRGNNPVYVNGRESAIDPVGPDGWYSMVDSNALGRKEGFMGKIPFSVKSLWCEPGGGYSYASSSIHIGAIMLKHITGLTLKNYVASHLAEPLGWGRWGFGYKNTPAAENPGGGGIALRSTDMLRFGYLLLREGKWKNVQVVPADFIRKATSASPYNPHYNYSLQFNVNTNGEIKELPPDAFWKAGSGGHCIFVVPSLDLVVWKLGGRDDQYSTGNTGLPQPEINENSFGPTEKPVAGEGDNVKTLKMVIDAINR